MKQSSHHQLPRRCKSSQCHVRTFVVVGPEPAARGVLPVIDRSEDVPCKPVVSKGSIVALEVGVLLRLAMLDVLKPALSLGRSFQQRAAVIFGANATMNHLRLAASIDYLPRAKIYLLTSANSREHYPRTTIACVRSLRQCHQIARDVPRCSRMQEKPAVRQESPSEFAFHVGDTVWVIAVMALLTNSLIRGMRAPNMWACTQMLLNYDLGLVRRGLQGAILSTLNVPNLYSYDFCFWYGAT